MILIIKKLFVAPVINKKIAEQQLLLTNSEEKNLSGLSMTEKSKIWVKECEIKYSIKILKSI